MNSEKASWPNGPCLGKAVFLSPGPSDGPCFCSLEIHWQLGKSKNVDRLGSERTVLRNRDVKACFKMHIATWMLELKKTALSKR